ncbi:hypothetical protein M0813_05866 [Anaeramoeba flamelloides]|nr:hypothetical protein M0813_05866 [Anaeramoeba flamelloides]
MTNFFQNGNRPYRGNGNQNFQRKNHFRGRGRRRIRGRGRRYNYSNGNTTTRPYSSFNSVPYPNTTQYQFQQPRMNSNNYHNPSPYQVNSQQQQNFQTTHYAPQRNKNKRRKNRSNYNPNLLTYELDLQALLDQIQNKSSVELDLEETIKRNGSNLSIRDGKIIIKLIKKTEQKLQIPIEEILNINNKVSINQETQNNKPSTQQTTKKTT